MNLVLSPEPVFFLLKNTKIKVNSVCPKIARGDLGTGEIGLPRLGEGRGGEAFQGLAVKVSCYLVWEYTCAILLPYGRKPVGFSCSLSE